MSENTENIVKDTNMQREFSIQRIYTKDQSFEAPNTPSIFEQTWEPMLDVHIQSRHAQLSDDLYEVVLTLTVTANSQKTVAFIAEVHQAGIFMIRNFLDEEIHRLLGQAAPSTLYPFARSIISSMVSEGSFPGLYLAPINFEAMYEQSLRQSSSSATESGETIN